MLWTYNGILVIWLKTRRMMEENISLVDIVIELLDARLPFSSKKSGNW